MQLTDKKVKDSKRILSPWRLAMHRVIFEADTPGGKTFDVVLLWAILISVLAVMLESVAAIRSEYGIYLRITEWVFTIIFTLEYFARIISVGRPIKYITSFLGVIDLLAVIPTYLGIFFAGTPYFIVIRIIRLLRIFRIFKLGRYVGEAQVLLDALKASRPKITVFLGMVISVVVIMGTLMYLIEGEENGFTSIPQSVYWAIVTMTTVGYGDIAPHTVIGRALASVIMILGFSIIAIPTGIVSVELTQRKKQKISCRACPECSIEGHDNDAEYCKHCGAKL